MRVVAVLVDHELPEAALRTSRAEVREVEGEYRKPIALGDRHDRRVGVAEVEIGIGGVERDRAAQQARRNAHDGVLPRRNGLKKQACSMAADNSPPQRAAPYPRGPSASLDQLVQVTADYRRAGGAREAVLPDFLTAAHAAVTRRRPDVPRWTWARARVCLPPS
jgi:hypothetical protein